MIARADQSDLPLWPVWFWLLVLVLILVAAVLFWASYPNAAPAQETPATAQVPATNPECSLFGHAVYRFEDGPVWLCRRIGCGEAWFVLPEQEPYNQEAEELVAETEAFLRKGGAA